MRSFRCRVCDNPLFFENSFCVSCRSSLAYSREEKAIVPVDAQGQYVDSAGHIWHICVNLNLSGCTWLTSRVGGQCFSCELTRTRPNNRDLEGLASYPLAEQAKRRLVVELEAQGLPVFGRDPSLPDDEDQGLGFDLISNKTTDENVVIGHESGIITIDLDEGDDAYREKVRVDLAEPYRTMLGHFRHEVGHYYEWQLVRGDDRMARCRELFGDESLDYQGEIARHYDEGAPKDWAKSYISTYATMHPFEDFAETWAHYLHICDSIETAKEYGLTTVGDVSSFSRFRDVVTGVWIPLSTALNQINRSMGKDDLYPFVIPAPVLEKLDFVATLSPRFEEEN